MFEDGTSGLRIKGSGGRILPGAPFSLLFLNKFNNNNVLDHLSGPLLGPLSQILRESVRSRLSVLTVNVSISLYGACYYQLDNLC